MAITYRRSIGALDPGDLSRHESRDGKLAVATATRAAELTNWKDEQVLSTLAAAYAESGDFAAAVRWQQRALELHAATGVSTKADQDRLALYKAGKPYRAIR